MEEQNILSVRGQKIDLVSEKVSTTQLPTSNTYDDLHKFLSEESWWELIQSEFSTSYWKKIIEFLNEQSAKNKKIYPPKKDIFTAFNACAVGMIRVVIIGQDPYHGPGQAQGMSFSVKPGVRVPPSLVNIFKELKMDMKDDFDLPKSGDLTKWAQHGVFLLNTSLTVSGGEAASHSECGWKQFTEAVLKKLSKAHPHLVFVLWGRHAQGAAKVVDSHKHKLFYSPHPSPFSADSGFFGSKFASKVNAHLVSRGEAPIRWNALAKD